MTATVVERSRPGVPESPPPGLAAMAWTPVGAVAGAFLVIELAVSARYGFHRDELYFLACSRHLAWGYVDQPPLVPAVAWLSTHLFGTSPVALRTLPAIAGSATVVLTAAMARELGGGRRAQVLAGMAAVTSAQVLAGFHLLSTAAFDIFFWAAISLVVIRLLRTGRERLWLVVGGLGGVALLNKWNVAFLLVAVAGGLVLGGRGRMLLSRWAWGGAALAVAIWLPNLVWNATHDWAGFAMLQALHHENSGLGASLAFFPDQLVVVGPALAVLWLFGLRRLLGSWPFRPVGIAYVVLIGLFVVTGGKSYYLAGLYFALFAAGAVWVEERLLHRGSGLWGWVVLTVGVAAATLPLTLPVLPEAALATSSWQAGLNKDLSATVGWPQLVAQLSGVADRLPTAQRREVVVFSGDYGAAGAVELYGARYGLRDVISGHNSYWWWGPPKQNGAVTIAVDLPRSYLLTIFSDVQPAGRVATPHGVWTEERGDAIWLCTGQKLPWARAWPAARHYG